MYTSNFSKERQDDFDPLEEPNNFETHNFRPGIDGLSPSYDVVIPRESPISRSPIGHTPLPETGDASPPPHHIGALFSPSSLQSEEFHRLLSPHSTPHSAPTTFTQTPNSAARWIDNLEEEQFDFDFGSTGSSDLDKTPSDFDDSGDLPWDSPPIGASPAGSSFAAAQYHGEHPYGEHPSRTLFVRNIHSSVDDDELRNVFGAHGDIRSMYTQCKHRGFVMISYYDIRAAKTALRQLQNTVICGRKIDIHYSIPKDNPSEKDQNQGTLVIFNLDPSIPNTELQQIFGQYGEIKEIRETPNKRHHKFVEFYDVRDAEKAMKYLNKTEIKGKKIKIEPSRPGRPRKTAPFRKSGDTPPDEETRRSPAVTASPPIVAWMYVYPGNKQRSTPTSPTLPASFGGPPGTTTAQDHTSPRYYPFSAPPAAYYGPSPWQTPAGLPFSTDPRLKRPPLPTVRPVRPPAATSSALISSGASPVSPQPAPAVVPIVSASPTYSTTPRDPPGSASPALKSPETVASPPKKSAYKEGKSRSREDKNLFTLDIGHVRAGEEKRTTLMIKNIPNKYSQKMLLSAVDINHRGRYDFFYLPIDFKNKCNVGYAFINFIKPLYIPSFYEEFNNKKWEKFNSEKVCEITFARIQGKNSLISHFQNSSLMCEDKPFRPIIFHSDGPNVGEVEPFPVGPNIRARSEKPHGETKKDKPADEP